MRRILFVIAAIVLLLTTESRAVNIQNVSMTRAPLRIEFTGNWEGPAPGQRTHVLTRPDLPPSTNTAQELEDYLNFTWFPQEFRDTSGARTGYAKIHILIFTGNDFNAELTLSDFPIP